MELKDSQTRENLMRAFAGESQARNRYTFAAELAERNGHYALKKVFEYTADQEMAHADVFYQTLKEMNGENIDITAGYPVNTSQDLLEQLEAALHNEFEEGDSAYPEFGKIAKEEGFEKIAGKFFLIAQVEQVHGRRFEQLAAWLREGKLYVSDVQTGWVCLKCGFVVESTTAPQNCPICDAGQGYFIRLELSPYAIQDCDESVGQ